MSANENTSESITDGLPCSSSDSPDCQALLARVAELETELAGRQATIQRLRDMLEGRRADVRTFEETQLEYVRGLAKDLESEVECCKKWEEKQAARVAALEQALVPFAKAAAAYLQHDDSHALLTWRAPCPGGSYHELLVEVGDLRAAARALEGEQG